MNTPSKPITPIAILVGFALVLFSFFSSVHNLQDSEVLEWEFYLRWITRGTGVFIAAVAAFMLLFRAIGGASLEALSPLILPFLAGAALISRHWAIVLALGFVALAAATMAIIRLSRSSAPDREL